MSNVAKSFDIFTDSLSVLHNYFDSLTRNYFSALYPAKILDLSEKSFFPCRQTYLHIQKIFFIESHFLLNLGNLFFAGL